MVKGETTTASASGSSKGKRKIAPRPPKDVKADFKDVGDWLGKCAKGLSALPSDAEYTSHCRDLANQLNTIIHEEILPEYKKRYEAVQPSREAGIKPKRCDSALTTFLFKYYRYSFPVSGTYGVCDLNKIASKAIAIYIREKGLGEGQFFTLDNDLYELFNKLSINGEGKTYLQLTQDRIDTIRNQPSYNRTSASAHIDINGDKVSMNYSALKIILPKFVVNYALTDPDQYVPQLEVFANTLDEKAKEFENKKGKGKVKTESHA